MKEVAAGIDIGGTNTVIGLVDLEGICYYKTSVKTNDFRTAEIFANEISAILIKALSENKDLKLKGIGIGAPNGNFYNGTIEFAPNLSWKGVIPLKTLFQAHFDIPVVLTNDANAAAIGEMIYGNARKVENFIFITLGTGVGSGIVVNGNMVYGHDGFAGEIGHVILFPDGRDCGCGRKGCLEAYCSAKGIVKTYHDLMKKNGKTVNSEIVTPHYIALQAGKGEPEAIETYANTGKILGLGLANSVAYTSPEVIYLFGGICNAGELLFQPTRESFEENLLVVYKNKIKILPSGIQENDAAILGAASLIWKEKMKVT